MKKKFLLSLMLITFTIVALGIISASAETEGIYTYTITDGEVTITSCDKSVNGNIEIPDTLGGCPVTSIGEYAFDNCRSLTSITIPESVTSIGEGAFEDCTHLTQINWNAKAVVGFLDYNNVFSRAGIYGEGINVVFGDSVENIPTRCFYPHSKELSRSPKITSVTIGSSVTSIGYGAFYGCSSLTSIIIPDSVTSINGSAFEGCSSLTSIIIPDSLTGIGENAFYNTAYYKKSSNWENDVLYMGNHLIDAKDTISGKYNVKEGTITIANGAFYNCYNLTNITLPDSVTSINGSAFEDCSNLKSVTIPDSVTSIGRSAFQYCYNLKSVTIPDSVTSIGGSAFDNCSSLTSITIPDSVTSIGDGAFAYTEYYKNSSNWKNDVLYIGNHLIDAKTTISGEYNIKEGTITIAGSAFYNCSNLTSITIPDSVTSIASMAFYNCTSLTMVYYNGNQEDWNKITIGDSNSYLINATKKFFYYVTSVDETGNKISKKMYDINSLIDISDIEKNGYATHLYTDIERKNEFDLTTQINRNTTLYVNYIKLNVLKLEGTTSVDIGVKGITQKISFETDKEAIYFVCTISYPDDLVLNEIKSDSFEIEYDNQTIEGNTYLYLTCIYNGNGNIPTYQEVSPFEFEFSITENVQTGDVFTVEISEQALIDNRGNVYQLENAECSEIKINSIKVTEITITGAEEIDCPTVYTAFVFPGNATVKTILWSVDNEEIATVSQDGVLTPLKRGTVVLRASATDGSEVYATRTISIVPGLAKVSDITSNIGVWDKQYSNAENTYTIYVPKSATSIKLTAKHSGILTSTSNQTFINNFPKTITVTSNETVLTLNYTCPDFEDNTYTITIKKFEGTKTEVSEDKKSFTIKPINVENGKTVILALYNGEQFVEMQSAVYTGEAVPFTTTKTYTKAKVIVWDDLTNLKPVCEVEKVE